MQYIYDTYEAKSDLDYFVALKKGYVNVKSDTDPLILFYLLIILKDVNEEIAVEYALNEVVEEEEKIEILTLLADYKNPRAAYELAHFYEKKYEETKEENYWNLAVQLYSKSARLDYGYAQEWYAFYLNTQPNANVDRINIYMKKAAEKGLKKAIEYFNLQNTQPLDFSEDGGDRNDGF